LKPTGVDFGATVTAADGRDGSRPSPATPGPALVGRIRAEVAEELTSQMTPEMTPFDKELLADDLISKAILSHARSCIERGEPSPSIEEDGLLAAAVRAELFGLGPLEPLLAEDSITDIHVVGATRTIIDHADGTKELLGPVVKDLDEFYDLVRMIGRTEGLSERRFDHAHPSINQQLHDGSRFFAVAWVSKEPHLFIRRHRLMDVTLEDLVVLGTLSRELAEFLTAAVKAHRSICVSGGQGAGKTTLLRALVRKTDPSERIVTIETDYELGLDRFPDLFPDLVALEAREENVEGAGAVSSGDLVRMAMRMAASRLCIGEVLQPEVVLPMLNAMHSGAAGSWCSIHANSSADTFYRLAALALQAPEHLEFPHTYAIAAAAFDLVIFVAKEKGGRHLVKSVREVTGFDGAQVTTNEIFAPDPGGSAVRTGVPFTESTRLAFEDVGHSERLM